MEADSKEQGNTEDIETIKSCSTCTNDLPPSCVEWVPSDPRFFIVGSYHLNSDTESGQDSKVQSRTGALTLYELENDTLINRETVSTSSGVLDLHFNPDDDHMFAVATSCGTIDVYRIDTAQSHAISKLRTFHVCDPSVLVLSLCWARTSEPPESDRYFMAFSLSSGQIGRINWSDQSESMELLKAHSLEAWTVACVGDFDTAFCEQDVFSGGDDSVVFWSTTYFHEARDEPWMLTSQTVPRRATRQRRTHEAGVTAILPILDPHRVKLPFMRNGDILLLTGSYDEYIQVACFSKLSGDRHDTLIRKHLGGGVWRLKIVDPKVPDRSAGDDEAPRHHIETIDDMTVRVLASCMHAGVKVLEIRFTKTKGWSVQIISQFVEHESMVYASDVRNSLTDEQPGKTVVSTSFYDKKICVWRVKDASS